MITTLLPLLSAFFVTLLLIPLFRRLALRCGVVDHPTHRKIHVAPTPYLGGAGIVLGIGAACAIAWLVLRRRVWDAEALRLELIFGAVVLTGILGVCDDVWVVRAKYKLAVQIVIVCGFAWLTPGIQLVHIPGFDIVELNDLALPVTVLWMLGLLNGLNLIDGVDGLAGSVGTVILGGIALLAWHLKDATILLAALSGIGALSAFLIFNWRPARIYMGDSGSLALGMLISTLLLSLGQGAVPGESPAVEPFPYQLASISLLALYPFFEITLTVLRRVLAGKPVGSADKGHIHHRLLKQGWSAPFICGFAALISGIAALTVYLGLLHYHGLTAGLLMLGGLLLGVLLHFCGFLEMLHPSAIKSSRPHFLIANHFIAMQRIKLEQAIRVGEVETLVQATSIEFGVDAYKLAILPLADKANLVNLNWTRPASAHGSMLLPFGGEDAGIPTPAFSDKCVSKRGSLATWTFEPLAHEDEIDVEYHVLMHDFMSRALRRAETLDFTMPQDAPPPEGAGQALASKALSQRAKAPESGRWERTHKVG